MLVLIYSSIDTYPYLLRKTSKVRLLLPVVNLDKTSVCGDRKTSFSLWQKRKIGIHIYQSFGLSGVTRIWGPNIGRSRQYRVWSHVCLPVAVVSQAYPGNAEICPGFPPPQAALRIILSNDWLVVLRLNVPVNNFSVMSGRSHRFLGN